MKSGNYKNKILGSVRSFTRPPLLAKSPTLLSTMI